MHFGRIADTRVFSCFDPERGDLFYMRRQYDEAWRRLEWVEVLLSDCDCFSK